MLAPVLPWVRRLSFRRGVVIADFWDLIDCLSPFPHRHFVRAPRSHVHPTATAQAPSHHAADGTHHAQQAIASFDTQAFYYTSLSFLSCGFRLLLSALACLVTLLYRYLLLLGLFHLDSFSIPLDNLAQVIAAEAVAPDDNHAAALAVPHKTWEAYISTIGRDLEMTGALCAAVLAYVLLFAVPLAVYHVDHTGSG